MPHVWGVVSVGHCGCKLCVGYKLCRSSRWWLVQHNLVGVFRLDINYSTPMGGGWYLVGAERFGCKLHEGHLVVNYMLDINSAAPLEGGWCGTIWLESLGWT